MRVYYYYILNKLLPVIVRANPSAVNVCILSTISTGYKKKLLLRYLLLTSKLNINCLLKINIIIIRKLHY